MQNQSISTTNVKSKRILFLSLILGPVFIYLLSLIVTWFLVPDSCIYHRVDPNLFEGFWFNFPASEGFHPVLSKLAHFILIGLGILTGIGVSTNLSQKK